MAESIQIPASLLPSLPAKNDHAIFPVRSLSHKVMMPSRDIFNMCSFRDGCFKYAGTPGLREASQDKNRGDSHLAHG